MTDWANIEGVAWVREMQRRIFFATLGIFSLALLVIVVRSLSHGNCPWADAGSLAALLLAIAEARRRPERIRVLMWLALGVMLADVADGLIPWGPRVLTATHVLMPTLVLYGAVMGELGLSLVTAASVFAVYGLTWFLHRPLAPADAMLLGNLSLATAGLGLLACAVWVRGRQLVAALLRRASDLQGQLDANQRLTAVLTHDIVNPLTALQGTLSVARFTGTLPAEGLARAERMAERMTAIVASVRRLNHGAGGLLPLAPATVGSLWGELDEVFSERLSAKGQRFTLTSGGDLVVNTDAKVLCASVLGNLLTNACKFSPAGAEVAMSARREGDRVTISLRNPGAGFSPEDLRRVGAGLSVGPRPGTDGELGEGHGLRIARFYLQRLQGGLHVENGPSGVVVSVSLPSAP